MKDNRLERLDARQWVAVNAWINARANGTVLWVTGTGKTHIAIKAIRRLRGKYPEGKINVIVPTTKLADDWNGIMGHIKRFGVTECKAYVVNTYMNLPEEERNCILAIYDECHRYVGKEAEYFNKAIDTTVSPFKLCLSATLSDDEIYTLTMKGLPVVDTLDLAEAKREGFISEYIIFNLGLDLPPELRAEYDKYDKMHNKNMRFFFTGTGFDFKLAQACTYNHQSAVALAVEKGWNTALGDSHEFSPKAIKSYANMWHMGMTRRKSILENAETKIDAAEYLIRKFPEKKIIVFSQITAVVDKLSARLQETARVYHSNVASEIYWKGEKVAEAVKTPSGTVYETDEEQLTSLELKTRFPGHKKVSGKSLNKQALEDFCNDVVNVLLTSKALDEGADIPVIDFIIRISGSSVSRQDVQRTGRGIRYVEGKITIIVNLYIKNTQDEIWLTKSQKEQDKKDIYYISNIDDVGEKPPYNELDFNLIMSAED